MNKCLLLLVTLCLGLSNFVFSTDNSNESFDDFQIINVSNLTEKNLANLMNDQTPNLVIEFNEGTVLPLSLVFDGNLFELIPTKQSLLKVKETIYVCFIQGDMFFSSDLKNWKSFADFFTGSVSFGIAVEDGQPEIKFITDLNFRY